MVRDKLGIFDGKIEGISLDGLELVVVHTHPVRTVEEITQEEADKKSGKTISLSKDGKY